MVLAIGVTIIDEVIPAVVVIVPIVFLMNTQQTGYVTIVVLSLIPGMIVLELW